MKTSTNWPMRSFDQFFSSDDVFNNLIIFLVLLNKHKSG